jgi:chromosome segregation ATPase
MSEKLKHHRTTVEMYRDLLQIEVRSLVQRVGELTGTVGEMFGEVNMIAIQLDESVVKMSRLTGGVDYCRTELGAIRETIRDKENMVNTLKDKIVDLEKQISEIKQERVCDCADGTCKHS